MKRSHKALLKAIDHFCPNPSTGAEIGVFRGELVKCIHSVYPDCQMVLVDEWRERTPDELYYQDRRMRKMQSEWDQIYQQALETIQSSEGPSLVYRDSSENVAHKIADHSLDFVYIDASHYYEDVLQDIALWLPKCRYLISGHDFGSMLDKRGVWGVSRAVREWFDGNCKIHRYKGNVWACGVKDWNQ